MAATIRPDSLRPLRPAASAEPRALTGVQRPSPGAHTSAAKTASPCQLVRAIAALHPRRPDDGATCNDAIYRDINQRIRAECDIIINNSTGDGSNGDMLIERGDGLYESDFEERLKGCEAGAEMATFDGMTFCDVHGGKEIVVVTPPSRCETLVKRMLEKGYDKPPYYINMVLGADKGFQGAMPYSHDILAAMITALPPQSIFCVSAIGPAQLPATTQAMLLGGQVRVGLEDNL